MFRQPRLVTLVVVLGIVALAVAGGPAAPAMAQTVGTQPVRLPGHVLPALTQATRVTGSGTASLTATAEEPLTITVVLKRDDQRGFDTYLSGLSTRGTRTYRRFLSQTEIADRFGPSKQSYDAVLSWLQGQGFTLTEGSDNRLTLTVRGTRSQTQRAFDVAISDYRIDQRTFYATEQDPALPANVGQYVQAVIGLANLAQPSRPDIIWAPTGCSLLSAGTAALLLGAGSTGTAITVAALGFVCAAIALAELAAYAGCLMGTLGDRLAIAYCDYTFGVSSSSQATASSGRVQAAANAQKVGLVEFDAFRQSDVADWLRLFNPASVTPQLSRLSTVAVNGGVASPGPDEAEVLLDINLLLLETSLSTNVVVYEAPPTTSYQTLFNRMIGDGVTVISNSWSYCEDQTTLADVLSIDAILAGAAASGISVFNASGDSGSTCLDGSPNTVGVPADVPNATAVGGSSMTSGLGATYGSERWWDGSQSNPPTGQGGFGVSRFFPRPAYQNGSTASPMRSVPDTVLPADPAQGLGICQASKGGCPTGLLYGGTSMSAPAWAAMAVFLNQSTGQNLGFLNPQLYPLAGTAGFHSAAGMGSDFAHVGLGSPNPDMLRLLLTGQTAGPVDPARSFVRSTPTPVSADGTTRAIVQVNLLDNRGRIVTGKNVALTAGPGSRAVISPPSGPSSVNGGAVVFTVTDTFAENLTLTATDTTDNITLSTTVNLSFVTPPATAGNIIANPTSVAADGTAFSTITVTLQNAQNQGASGKVVNLTQGNGRSKVTGPTPAVTDSSGQTTFTVTNTTAETVTYSAIDVTDGNLPIPGTATVTFTGAGAGTCANLPMPTAAPGYAVSTFASGFTVRGSSSSNCIGPIGVAFDPAGALYVTSPIDDALYKFGPGGGVASAATKVKQYESGSCPTGLTFGKDGQRLYLARQFCNAFYGELVEISPTTGEIVKNFGTPNCVTGVAIDPLSGDLFYTLPCGWFGWQSIYRLSNPTGSAPVATVYATPSSTFAGVDGLTFAPDGTLYAAVDNKIARVNGTNSATPGAFTFVADVPGADGVALVPNPTNPSAPTLYVGREDGSGKLTKVDLTTTPPTLTDVLTGGSRGDFLAVGPDGCIYADQSDRIVKVTNADGACPAVPTSAFPTLKLAPPAVQPDPQQGTPQTFTATFFNVSVPAGTPVSFLVSGANTQVKQATTDANGIASFTYSGVKTGTDTIQASATVNGSTLTSNTAAITWAAGKHTTFLTLNLSPSSSQAGTSVTLKASLSDVSVTPPAPVAGASISFNVGGQSCMGITDAAGMATCSITPAGPPRQVSLAATYAGTAQFLGSTDTRSFSISGAVPTTTPTTLTYTGATTLTNGSSATLSAILRDNTSTGIAGKTVSFTLGSGAGAQTCSGTTGGGGGVSCMISSVNQPVGPSTVTAAFAGDSTYAAASVQANVTVQAASATPTTLTYTGPTNLTNGASATLSATLKETAGATPVSGKTVSFTLGSGAGAQTCSAMTNGAGTASCTIASVNQPVGAGTVAVAFAGDAGFAAASVQAPVTIAAPTQPTVDTVLTLTPAMPAVVNSRGARLMAALRERVGRGPTVGRSAPVPNPIVGVSVTFTIGAGTSVQTCSGLTNVAGVAECMIDSVDQPLPVATVSATFAGDSVFKPSSDQRSFRIGAPVTVSLMLAVGSVTAGQASVTAQATLGGVTMSAGGTVTYVVYRDAACKAQLTRPSAPRQAITDTRSVTSGVAASSEPIQVGTDATTYWQVVYTGDANNAGATSACTPLPVSAQRGR